MGCTAEAAEVQIPPVVIPVHPLDLHAVCQNIEPLFTLASANDLADLRYEHIHGGDGLTVVVASHVEGFEVEREVGDDDRFLDSGLS